MNLLLLDQFSDPGGAQMNLLELLPAVRAAGWQALVGLPGEGELFERVRGLGFETARIPCGPYGSGSKSVGDGGRFLADTPRLAAAIGRLARQAGADVVYLNGPRLLPGAALAGIECPVLFHSHSFLGGGAVQRLAGRALRRLTPFVVGACEFVAAPWRPFVSPERVSVIYNGVAGPAHPPAREFAGPPRIACIGRLAPEKGQRDFVAAAVRIHRELPECRFVICGAPLFGDRAAQRYAEQVQADARGLPVEFRGWVDDIAAQMAELDLLLVPSSAQEATPRVILEAFASGVPVVAYRSGGIPEVVDHGSTGLLVKNNEEMAAGVIDLLAGDAERRTAMAEAARSSWERRFTLQRYQKEILGAVEAAAGSAGFTHRQSRPRYNVRPDTR